MSKRLLLLGLTLCWQAQAGLTFNNHPLGTPSGSYDASITGDPNAVTIQATIDSALALYQAFFVDSINVNIQFKQVTTGLGMSSTQLAPAFSYASVRSALLADAKSTDDATANLTLTPPGGGGASPIPGGSSTLDLTTANARALGLCTCFRTFDGVVSLNLSLMNLSRSGPQDPSKYDLLGVVMHEINEVLGTGSGLGGAPTPIDLFRYDGSGSRSFNTDPSASSYFSINGTTLLAQYNQSAGADYGDFIAGGPLHVQNAFGTPGAQPDLNVELRMLDVIGFDSSVPEPATVSMMLLGLGSLALLRRR